MSWNIVVVDDEAIIADGLAKIIRHIGEQYRVSKVFYDSMQAYQYLKEHYATIDLLITDIRMPKFDGLELIERAHSLRPDMLCAVLTGFSEFEYAKKAVNQGVASYLVKPIDMQELRQLLSRLSPPKPAPETERRLTRETLYMKQAIETHYRDFNMDVIVDHLQLSRDYLFRMFKKEVGVKLMDYLLDVRMRRAKEMLRLPGEFKIYEVSEQVGYQDYAYFSKVFKKFVGTTPKGYQKYTTKEK